MGRGYREAFEETSDEGYATATANDRFIIPEGAHWKDARSASRDVGRALLNSFQVIESANPERLKGVFGNAAWTDKAQMPDEPNVNDTLGWVYYQKGLPNLAVSPLEAAAKLAPGSAGIRYRLGMAYAKNGDVTRAREALTAALKIDPGFPEAGDAKRQLGDLNK